MSALSVVICTHNPRPDYLRRVLDALRAQTLPLQKWELLLIDNASKVPLASAWDLSWHPRARHVREDRIGLTSARLRGIKDSDGEILVFVDDDNLLATDYLEQVISIFHDWPTLGAIGAGVFKGEFEIPPPDSILPYIGGLVIGELKRSYWSNVPVWSELTSPLGAGLCIRRNVAEEYAHKVMSNSARLLLGRSGTNLGAGEDGDIVLVALDLGMGTGRFISLQLIHLIPRARLTEDYIIRLHAGFAAGNEIMSFIKNKGETERSSSWKRKVRFFLSYRSKTGLERRMFLASEKARTEARRRLAASSLNG